jgi:glutamine amidotransferase
MCRLLGIVSSETTDYRFCLRHAPRSLAAVSREHPHGWGLAVHERARGWQVHRHVACAGDDERFHATADTSRGEVLVAHVRKRTVGPLAVHNTHPFRRGRWVFAHNGTIEDMAFLERHAAPERLAEVEGDTDSERYFAYLLTFVDRAGATEGATDALDEAIVEAITACAARPRFGAANFLLSDGDTLYALRSGRTLHLLTRGTADPLVTRWRHDGVEVETPWSSRRRAVLIASDRISEEPWRELEDGTLLRVDGGVAPRVRVLLGDTG